MGDTVEAHFFFGVTLEAHFFSATPSLTTFSLVRLRASSLAQIVARRVSASHDRKVDRQQQGRVASASRVLHKSKVVASRVAHNSNAASLARRAQQIAASLVLHNSKFVASRVAHNSKVVASRVTHNASPPRWCASRTTSRRLRASRTQQQDRIARRACGTSRRLAHNSKIASRVAHKTT